jgi:hypothetical protein
MFSICTVQFPSDANVTPICFDLMQIEIINDLEILDQWGKHGV